MMMITLLKLLVTVIVAVICIISLMGFNTNLNGTKNLPELGYFKYTALHKNVSVSVKRVEVIKEWLNVSRSLPMIYFISPTYARPEQLADMTRLMNTLAHVEKLHWLIGEDGYKLNPFIIDLLNRSRLSYTYQTAPVPKDASKKQVRGVSGRRAGISWLQENNVTDGVMYFGDDDNSYDLRVFDEMRYTKRLSMWPVGFAGKWGINSPIVEDGIVTGFFSGSVNGQTFAIDMAGFAVAVHFLFNEAKSINISYCKQKEDAFLQGLGLSIEDIEPKADNCSKIYVWHTRTEKSPRAGESIYKKMKRQNNNLAKIVQYLL